MSAIRLSLLLLLIIGSLSAQDTVRFTPTVGYPTFAVREPVLTIKPGTVLVSNTNFGDYYQPGGGDFPGEVGPFYIEGATTEDMLSVEIIKVRPNHTLAGAQIYAGFGAITRSGVAVMGPVRAVGRRAMTAVASLLLPPRVPVDVLTVISHSRILFATGAVRVKQFPASSSG